MPAFTISRIQNLRETNRRLHFLLDSLVPNFLPPTAAAPQHMSALLSELLRAGAELRSQPLPAHGLDPELDEEIDNYRSHVEQLRELLPFIQSQLLRERARLEDQRTRVQSAAEWARASRQTLP
jgi:hypothetical protein